MAEEVKVTGLPAPTGSYAVGSVDLMHEGLLVRLYYPTEREGVGNYERGSLFFKGNYSKAFLEAFEIEVQPDASDFLTGNSLCT